MITHKERRWRCLSIANSGNGQPSGGYGFKDFIRTFRSRGYLRPLLLPVPPATVRIITPTEAVKPRQLIKVVVAQYH